MGMLSCLEAHEERCPRQGEVSPRDIDKDQTTSDVEQDVTDILKEKGANGGAIDVEDKVWFDAYGLEPRAVEDNFENELNDAGEKEIFVEMNYEEMHERSVEDTQYVINFDAEDGSSSSATVEGLGAIERPERKNTSGCAELNVQQKSAQAR